MKSYRQEKILEIITTQEIETQNQLIEALAKEGLSSTQATLSRDIRELRLVKELGANGKHKYVSPAEGGVMNYAERLRTIFRESVTSLACAQNIVVIKTLPGLASAACSAIDGMGAASVVGTLAGDDTGILIMKDTAAAASFCKDLRLHMKK